jgi:hypothetical protein
VANPAGQDPKVISVYSHVTESQKKAALSAQELYLPEGSKIRWQPTSVVLGCFGLALVVYYLFGKGETPYCARFLGTYQ